MLGGEVDGLVPPLVEDGCGKNRPADSVRRRHDRHELRSADVTDRPFADAPRHRRSRPAPPPGHRCRRSRRGRARLPTPEHIKAAGRAAIDANFTKYTPSAGIMELREAISDRYREDYGVEYAADEVIATAGGKQALYNAAMALFEEGDEVITHAPYWPIDSRADQARGRDAGDRADACARTASRFTPSRIIDAITPRTKAIVINSPCNPTGALISEEAITAIADAAARARHLGHCRRHLREADLRPGAAQPGRASWPTAHATAPFSAARPRRPTP